MKPLSRMAKHLILAVLACICVGAEASKEFATETGQVQAFLSKLLRSVTDVSEKAKLQHEERREWCQEQLSFLGDAGKQSEDILESLRASIRELKKRKEDTMMLVQMTGTDGAQLNESILDSRSRALQVSVKARLGELQEQLKLRGVSSSATHRFATAVKGDCELSQKRLKTTLEASQLQEDSLRSAIEALTAAEALHGIDESSATDVGERRPPMSFMQVTRAGKFPDLLSLFGQHTDSSRDSTQEVESIDALSLPSQSSSNYQHEVQMPAMPKEERPKVYSLLAKMQNEGNHMRSEKEAWCQKEESHEQAALQEAKTSAMMFQADAAAHGRLKAQLEEELNFLKQGTSQSSSAARHVLQEAANTTKELASTARDDAIAAKILGRAIDGLSGLQEQWWGKSTSNPVDTAKKSLADAQRSFAKEAEEAEGSRQLLAKSAKAVAGHARELITALSSESQKLELAKDGHSRRQRRSEGSQQIHEYQVRSSESYLKSLRESCDKKVLQQQTRDKQAEMRALHDAEMVFAGQRIKTSVSNGLRGTSANNLSPMEKAALEMGVSMD